MDSDAPKLHYVTVLISGGCFIGLIWGGIIAATLPDEYAWARGPVIVLFSIIVGLCGWGVSGWLFKRREQWARLEFGVSYEGYETEDDIDGKVILSLVINTDGLSISKEIHGLTRPEWQQLGAGVVKYKYEFSSRKLQSMFNPSSRGATIYEIVTPILKDPYVGVLVPDGSGVSVTDGIGEHFFDRLAKGDLKVLRLLDPSPSPTPAQDIV